MSFLPSLFLLSQILALWASCYLDCTGFPLHSAFTARTLAELCFCCAWPLPRRGWAKVASASLHWSHSTRCVGRVCNFLSSVSPQQRFQTQDQCYSLVTAQSFIWQVKEITPSRREGGLTPKKRSLQLFFKTNLFTIFQCEQLINKMAVSFQCMTKSTTI